MTRTLPPGALERELADRLSAINARLTARAGSPRSHGRAKAKFAGLAAVISLLLISVSGVLAVHDLGLFELDRNATDGAASGDDWGTLYGGGGSADGFTGIIEDTMGTNPLGTVGTQFQAGGSKDDLDISPGGATGQVWKWDPGEPLDKDDITNAYAAAYVNTVDTGANNIGDLIIYYGLDRFANNGSAQVGFWFFQDDIGLTTTASGGGYLFSGHHQVGDVLVQSNFTNGGVIDNVTVYEWVGSGGDHGTLNTLFTAADCVGPPASGGDDPACATVNRGDQASPWPYTPKFGTPGTFPAGSFFEGGINITRLVPDAACFSTFMAETRSSTPFDSRLKDFALGNFDLCSIDVEKTGDTLSKIGDSVDYTITITNDGAVTLYKDDISDTLLGAITTNGVDQANSFVVSNTCGASLAPSASCMITLSRTVLASDPDPLPNTVTVHYTGKADLSDTGVSDTDDHSVNLFQPAIELTKTGDTLSKIGDSVDYTITLTNNSSADTPDLTCDFSDSLLGARDQDLTIGTGEEPYVINTSRTVQEGDPDPLVNTASVTCTVDGFGNELTDTDSHSVNLFQPSVSVAKTCEPLTLPVGQMITFTCTVTNTSSADTPNLIFDFLTDTVDQPAPAPDVDLTAAATAAMNASACAVLSDGEVCSFSYTFTPTVVGTHVNTIAVHYNPNGFPNDILDDGQCTFTTTGGEGCTPGFFKRWTNVWDGASDAITINVKAAIDSLGAPYTYGAGGITTQLFRDIFGLTPAEMTAVGLDPNLTMEEAINLGGGDFFKLARHGVAALLSSASVAYPFSTTAVLTMVHDAVVSLSAEPTATELADANNLSHQNCPTS